MDFIERHKALIITALITGTLVMALFSMSLTQKAAFISESFYELQPEKTLEEKLLEQLALNETAGQSTNKAFNETDEFKEMMKNFKSLDRNDFEKNAKETKAENLESPEEETQETQTTETSQESSINDHELSSYSKINDIIAMRSAEKRQSKASNGDNTSDKTSLNNNKNRNSSVSYSLKDRKEKFLPPPVYLCEESGKIVINISVNANGGVTDASYNRSASSSTNECLIDSALEYAREARFDASSTQSQIGTITYIFVGKY